MYNAIIYNKSVTFNALIKNLCCYFNLILFLLMINLPLEVCDETWYSFPCSSQAKGAGSVFSFNTVSLAVSKHIVEQSKLFSITVSFGLLLNLCPELTIINLFRGYKLHQNEDDLWCSINFDEVVVTLIDCRKCEVIDQSAMLYVTRKHSCWSSGGSWTHWRPNTSFSKSTLGLYRELKLWVKMICFWCKATTAVVHKPGLDDLQFNL